jgi:hypothetical protein
MSSRKQIILESVIKHARAAINGINGTIADQVKELSTYPRSRHYHAHMIHSIFGLKTPDTYAEDNEDIVKFKKYVPAHGPFLPNEVRPKGEKTVTVSTIFHSLHRLRDGLQQKLEQLQKKAPSGGSEEHQWKINKHAAALADTHKIMDTLQKGEWGGIPERGVEVDHDIPLYASQLRAARSGIADVIRNLRAKREQNYAPEVMAARKERPKLT